MEDETHHIEAHGSTRHLREQKEGGTRPMAFPPKTLLKKTIDGREVQLVIDGQQQECHGEITQDESQAGLHVGHIGVHHHARHTDEGHTRDAGPHHAIGHHVPWRPSVAAIERVVVRPACRQPADNHEQCAIGEKCDDDDQNAVCFFIFAAKITYFCESGKQTSGFFEKKTAMQHSCR